MSSSGPQSSRRRKAAAPARLAPTRGAAAAGAGADAALPSPPGGALGRALGRIAAQEATLAPPAAKR
jgi:hypothetical protein